MTGTLAENVVRQIEVGDCWEWTGYKTRNGYGFATVQRKQWLVHRYVYTCLVGSIPVGLTLDHLCRNRACCNPDHLEPVTITENCRRGTSYTHYLQRTHCPSGHSYAVYAKLNKKGHRICMECRRGYNRKYRDENYRPKTKKEAA